MGPAVWTHDARPASGRSQGQAEPLAALVPFGDRFLQTLQSETAARQRASLGRAREVHQTAFMSAYLDYLRDAEVKLCETQPAVHVQFFEHRQKLRHAMSGGTFRLSAEVLARFDAGENYLLSFAEFFHKHPQQRVPDFWEWDARLNPNRFGGGSVTVPAKEARA